MGSMLDLQSLEASSDAIDPRASGASFMCNGETALCAFGAAKQR